MTEIDVKIEELKGLIEENENIIATKKEENTEFKKQIRKLERIKSEIAEIVI